MLFAVPNDMHKLLKITDFVSDMKLFPIPRNRTYTDKDGGAKVDSEYLQLLIEEKRIEVEDSYSGTTEEETTEEE